MALAATFGTDTLEAIRTCRVLVVGAGGIGCELLKNLVSSGFKDIVTIDLDTIEVSNLNRQFLFRKCHVGQSKAETAAEAVTAFDSSAKVVGHCNNIKAGEYSDEFFQAFDIVLNALDNTEARRHVNRMCLASKRAFVESGTQGFVGQVIPIVPKLTQCWECTPKQNNQRTYPVCTIRATPDKPVHCIVWAKLIFALLFGAKDDSNMIKDLKVEKKDTEDNEAFARHTFVHLFETDIVHQCSMEDKWKNRQKPVVIACDETRQAKVCEFVQQLSEQRYAVRKRDVLPIAENAALFLHTFAQLCARKEEHGELSFDKDDEACMRFVACAANLRMHCYGIAQKSEFDVKGIAGNIIHAIATTNAIVAGAMVVQCMHILQRKRLERAVDADADGAADANVHAVLKHEPGKVCWVQSKGPRWLYPQNLEAPLASCFICQKSTVHVTLDPELFTLGTFLTRILCKHLGFKTPDIVIEFNDAENKKVHNYIEAVTEYDDDEEKAEKEELYGRALDDPAIKILNGVQLDIHDEEQKVEVQLKVHYLALDEEKHPNGYEVTNEWSLQRFTVKEKKPKTSDPVDDSANKGQQTQLGQKRKQMHDMHVVEEDHQSPPAKKQRR